LSKLLKIRFLRFENVEDLIKVSQAEGGMRHGLGVQKYGGLRGRPGRIKNVASRVLRTKNRGIRSWWLYLPWPARQTNDSAC